MSEYEEYTGTTDQEAINPKTLGSITSDDVETLKKRWRAKDFSEHTIEGYLAYLKSALNWAKRRGLILKVPHFEMPKPAPSAKGRPISGEEFDRIKEQARKKRDNVEEWTWYLNGLWWSGMRIEESMKLHWTDGPVTVDLSGKFPLIRFAAEGHKARRDELCPIAPEFAEMLLSVPESDREGFVFNPITDRTGRRFDSMNALGNEISRFGQRAGVKVSEKKGKVKYASAHDFRRSFGSRWSKRVMPAVLMRLMRLMRHKTIATTMAFYAVDDAESVAETAWEAVANSSANTASETAVIPAEKAE